MTQVILKENEFIIRVKNTDIINSITGSETFSIEIVNPHKEGYNSDHLEVLKSLLQQLS